MKNILDNFKAQQKLDKSNLYSSVIDLPKQALHAYEANKNLTLPDSYKQVKQLVMSGMGGSGLGARAIESIFFSDLKIPLIRINNYRLPSWVGPSTLVICSSYSGTTEETLQTAQQAIAKKSPWMAICAGGKLLKLAQKHHAPYYQIEPKFNPSQQPRMAIAYSIVGHLMLVAKAGLLSITKKDLDNLVKAMNQVISQSQVEIKTKSNPAKKLAQKLANKQVIFVAADHLAGPLHTVKNQMNENAKHLSHRHDIPELNHHLMEGLRFPKTNPRTTIFFFVDSDLYPSRLQTRLQLTKDVVAKNKLTVVDFKPLSKAKLSQAFELIQFGAFVNYYLSLLHRLDPTPIPWVDYFKTKLGQSLGDWK